MKVLLMTASIGSGHIRAAQALFEEFKAQYPEDEIKIIDFTDRKNAFLPWLFKSIYLKMLAYLPNLYDIFYKVSEGGALGNLTGSIFSALTAPFMRFILKREQPDIIVATHPFPEGAAAFLRKLGMWKKPLLVAVLTDYSLHDIWLYNNVDIYFVATDYMKKELIKRGYGDMVEAAGIPISKSEYMSKEEAKKKLNLKNDNKTILIMGGGLGLGGIEKTMGELEDSDNELTVLVVTGQNNLLYEKTKRAAENSKHDIKVFSYTKEIYTLMSAADLLITKPGALTMTEAFSMGLPMLLHEPIPGPEAKNADFAEKKGAALWVHSNESILEKAKIILFDENLYEKMSLSAKKLDKKNTSKKIIEILSRVFSRKNKIIEMKKII